HPIHHRESSLPDIRMESPIRFCAKPSQGEKEEAPRPKAEPATAGRRLSGAPAQGPPRQRRNSP
ncbi:hypothetical protein, partial [Mesorhizobium sp. WSM3859]|uniref:hypothetical protein n=1 Tax=Mesorhizobium sp. WSM3859 TaxID=2029402 RepID=UPI001AECA155